MGKIINGLRAVALKMLFGSGQRSYEASQMNRFTQGSLFSNNSINQDIRGGLRPIRNRVRNTIKNDGYAAGYLHRYRVNGVGSEGPTLQNRAKKLNGDIDSTTNRVIEDAWVSWCKKSFCTMAGTMDMVQVMWLWSDYMKRDGEFLCRMIEGPGVNKFGFSLEMLDPEDLDESYTRQLDNGNVILMGIEYNPWRRPVAFWLRQKNLQSDLYSAYQTQLVRVPAEEIIFSYDVEYSKQMRAVSPMVQILISLNMTKQWEEASLINASSTAQTMGFLTRKNLTGGVGAVGDATVKRMMPGTTEEVETGDTIAEFNPGMIQELPYGYEFSLSDPKYPTDQHGPFLKTMLRRMATALKLSYNSWANDYEGVNYSSLRSSLLDERDHFMMFQTLMRVQFLEPVFERWLRMAMLTGAVDLPFSEYDRICKPVFMGRRWQWVDPEKEVNASLTAINGGLSTYQKELGKQGDDVYDTFEQLAVEKELATKHKLNLNFNGVKSESKKETGTAGQVTE